MDDHAKSVLILWGPLQSRSYNIIYVKPVLRVFSMQTLHVNKLLDEASCHISDAIKADGAGNTKSALEHYSVGVEKLDAAINEITDEKTRLFYTRDRTAVAKRITMILKQSADCASKPI